MKDEIKEILEDYGCIPRIKKLGDYITNLQEENKELRKNQIFHKNGVFCLEYDKETLRDMVEDLQQENERLNKEISRIMEIIDLNAYNYGYQIEEEITGGDSNE